MTFVFLIDDFNSFFILGNTLSTRTNWISSPNRIYVIGKRYNSVKIFEFLTAFLVLAVQYISKFTNS